jgi:hypothetical protein
MSTELEIHLQLKELYPGKYLKNEEIFRRSYPA